MLITEITHLIFTQSRMWRWVALKPTSTPFNCSSQNCSLQGALPHRSPVVRWQSFLILEIEVSIFLSFLLQICSTFSHPGDQGLISIKFGITPTSIMNQNHPLLVKLKNSKNSVLTFIKGGKNLTVQFLISKRIWFLFWPLGFEVRKWVVTIIWFQVPRHPCPLPQLLQEWVWDETSERVKMVIKCQGSRVKMPIRQTAVSCSCPNYCASPHRLHRRWNTWFIAFCAALVGSCLRSWQLFQTFFSPVAPPLLHTFVSPPA